jgi:parallel beta-helix repeat protein
MNRKHLYATIIFLSSFLAGIQPGAGAIPIPSNTSVGDWDDASKTYTLTQDLTEPIEIVSNGITLDGAGHTLISSWIPPYAGAGVSLYGRTDVTIRNLTMKKFGPGIYLFNSSNNTLTGNTVSNCSMSGICLFNSSDNTLTGNITSNNLGSGIVLWDDCNANTVTGNSAKLNKEHGIWLVRSHLNQVYNNNFISNTRQASVTDGSGNMFNLPAPYGGNYWSNWSSPDDNGYSSVDRPYVFLSGQDDLPWAVPNGWDLFMAREMLQLLTEQVVVLNLHESINNGLDVRIETALGALDDVNDRNDVGAVNSLRAFINAVEALPGDEISEEDADVLMTAAQQIIDLLLAG